MEEKTAPNLTLRTDREHPILLMSSGEEMVRFDPDGKIYIRGEEVDSNRRVYEAFLSWMSGCICTDCAKKVGSILEE